MTRNFEPSPELTHRIPERGRAEENLRDSDQQYRTVLEMSPLPMWVVDMETLAFLAVNQAATRHYGYSWDEFLTMTIHDVCVAEGGAGRLPDPAGKRNEDAQGGGFERTLCRHRKRNGSLIEVEATSRPIVFQRREAELSLVHDITELRRAERRFRELLGASEKLSQLASIVQYADDAIAGITLEGVVLSWNPGAERMFGYGARDVIGSSIAMLAPAGGPEDLVRNLPVIRRGEPVLHFESTLARKDRQLLDAWVTLSPIKLADGTITGASLVARETTERRRSEREIRDLNAELERRVAERTAELKRSNEELQQFVYVASHDLQEPLRMVSSYTQLVAKRYKGKLDADADDFISFAVDGATRMHDLINDLLLYSRLDTRGKPFVPTDCREVLASVMSNLRVAIEENSATIALGDLPTITADSTQLGQLFQNLIGNAIKFHRAGVPPVVGIEAESRGSEWLFSVSDNGIGIDPRHAERVFIIFQRLHGRAEYPGTGIGLAICKKIVQRHGGRVWVEARPEGGSVFRFTLPRRKEDE